MARLGRMKLLQRDSLDGSAPQTTGLLISHPNFNGMQMNR